MCVEATGHRYLIFLRQRQSLSLSLEFTKWLDWLATEPQGSASLPTTVLELQTCRCAQPLHGDCGAELRSAYLRGSKHFITEPSIHPGFYFVITKIPIVLTALCLTYSTLKTYLVFVCWSCLDQCYV